MNNRTATRGDINSQRDILRANATSLVTSGVDLKTAQTRLGHSDPRLTLAVYAQATSNADRAAADAIGEWFADEPRTFRGLPREQASKLGE